MTQDLFHSNAYQTACTASQLLCQIVPKLANGCSITPDYNQ
jgi:hypothetical protein